MKDRQLEKLQQLIDFHFNLDTIQADIADDAQLRQIDNALAKLAASLDDIEDTPEDLTGKTLAFIKHYEQSRAVENKRSVKFAEALHTHRESSRLRWILGNFRDLATIAAGVILVFLVSQPGLQVARDIAEKHACTLQMRQVGQALQHYARDNNDLLPQVYHQPGAKWWHVGSQDEGKTSNTRNFFLLVKNGYLSAKNFICPAANSDGKIRLDFSPEQLLRLRDFPDRQSVNYSFRLVQPNEGLNMGLGRKNGPLMTDQNPLFADFDAFFSEQLDLNENPELLKANSPNHNGKGQNVLFDDGHVDFATSRRWGFGLDDMFTIENTTRYEGTETPTEEVDAFIAP